MLDWIKKRLLLAYLSVFGEDGLEYTQDVVLFAACAVVLCLVYRNLYYGIDFQDQ